MEWVLRGPQIHSTFSDLGYAHPEGYHVNENCNATLESILHNILNEDKNLRTYRRSINFGQNINKDIIPLLINVKEDKTTELLIQILVNLTIPVECLLSVETISNTDIGRHTIFEINGLLGSAKSAFIDHRATKVVIEFLKKNSDVEQTAKLSAEQCTNISNTLLFLRNILHIPEDVNSISTNSNGPPHTIQNKILWNLFSQSIDRILIKLMTIPDSINWGVTMVQLIALLYKDQHVTTLHRLLNVWLETSVSESSDDNESNTSPPKRGSDDSSPMLTDPTSDSSDTCGNGKINNDSKSPNNDWETASKNVNDQNLQTDTMEKKTASPSDSSQNNSSDINKETNDNIMNKDDSPMEDKEHDQTLNKKMNSETSDCGYGTQIENQAVISTSSNEDELPEKKLVHQKPHNPKQKPNNKVRTSASLQDRKRKKIVKRGKTNIINIQGLSHNSITDDDISNVLKEFTVDFLLRGYNSLVKTLHTQILTNFQLQIDTSHFFWLVTYFLKFATQIELDLEHVCSVLSYDIALYLTAEGVNLCEQFELAIKLDGNDLKPSIRRLHLVVTAIREFVQAIEVYKKSIHISQHDKNILLELQMKMCETEELRSLFVLLLRNYNPIHHSKQYLQDLVVTNHILLLFLDGAMKSPEYKGPGMADHIKQFATREIMYQYGLLLEDYEGNGEFVNDCVFTIMHHVGGELGRLIALFQPNILKTFTSIWKSDFEICDDWTDLVECVINTFIKKPHTLLRTAIFRLDTENFDDDKVLQDLIEEEEPKPKEGVSSNGPNTDYDASGNNKWTDDELSAFNWIYMQSNTSTDIVGEIVRLFKEDGIIKTRDAVIRQLRKQSIIDKKEFDKLIKAESGKYSKRSETKDVKDDDIGKLCEHMANDGKSRFLDWVQSVLLETCFAKIYLEKKKLQEHTESKKFKADSESTIHSLPKKVTEELPVMSPVSYHSLLSNQSVPLVPWNCEQAAICKDLKFLQLLHKLGFNMPVDTGKVFIRIPYFWTADFLYEVASKISPIDTTKLKFSMDDISESSTINFTLRSSVVLLEHSEDISMASIPENLYQIHKQKHIASIVNFTPMPGSSFDSTCDERNAPSWLDVVQKSQEFKLSLELQRTIIQTKGADQLNNSDAQEVTLSSEIKTCKIVSALRSPELIEECDIVTEMSLLIPVDGDSKREPSPFDMDQADSEYCNSSCDTASVASDLTRMYVSDEDEKPEVIYRPIALKHFHDDQNSEDLDNDIARKRVRFSTPF